MIFCILVTFKPDLKQLKLTVDSLISQIDKIVIVKNSNEELYLVDKKIYQIQLEHNMGIAYAQNCGIEYAITNGANYIMFSDQDTVYPSNFVQESLSCLELHKNDKLAAVAPLFYNENKKQYAQINIKKTKSITADIGKEYEIAHAISSGTVSPCVVFLDIGLMNERLFIDFVDFEWCWRAIEKGYKMICDTNLIIHHNMGDSYKKIFNKKIVRYSDFRNHYFFRNGTYLLFHSHLLNRTEWIRFFAFMFVKSILFLYIEGFSFNHFKLLSQSIKEGITNKF